MVNLHLQRLVGKGVGAIGGNGALRDFRAFLGRGSRAGQPYQTYATEVARLLEAIFGRSLLV